MHSQVFLTELNLESPLPPKAQLWLVITLFVGTIYAVKTLCQTVPPEDHVATAFILCCLLTQLWISFEKTVVRFSLSDNRCWVRHHRLGTYRERSLPVSQIHSAKLEHAEMSQPNDVPNARIVLVTSLGIIPISEKYQGNPARLHYTCQQINQFLESEKEFFKA